MTTLSTTLMQTTCPNATRVAILGAESTGKTTLCQDLVRHCRQDLHINAKWVVEYTRPYAEAKFDRGEGIIDWGDLLPIAIGQMQAENEACKMVSEQGGGLVFCDTSLFEIMVYSYLYFDACPTPIEQAVEQLYYDLIVLTGLSVPWQADNVRESPHGREATDASFVEALSLHNLDYVRIDGGRKERVQRITELLKLNRT